jgi:hypothetical protein
MKRRQFIIYRNPVRKHPERGDNRLWKLVNSAFFLWALSAVFVTVGGSYFNQLQKCAADADTAIERWDAISDELENRDIWYEMAIYSSSTIDDLRRSPPYTSADEDLKNKTVDELERARDRILRKVERDDLSTNRDKLPSSINESIYRRALSIKTNEALQKAKSETTKVHREFLQVPACDSLSILRQLLTGTRKILATEVEKQVRVHVDPSTGRSTVTID